MSTPAFAAATAVPIDAASERRAWFQALCDTYEADRETSWDGFVQNLTAAAEQAGVGQGVVTEFVRVMAELPAPLEVVAEMHQAGVDTLDAAYEDVAQAGAGFEEGAADTDPQVWHATLHELGARWDRDEASWQAFREWFAYETGQRGLGAEGQAFVEYAEAGDKIQVFDEYGIPGSAQTSRETAAEPAADAPAVAEFPVVAEGDSGDWVAYADELLTRAGY